MRVNTTILHRLFLWYLDRPEAEAQLYKDEDQNWQAITVRSYWLNVVRIAHHIQERNFARGDRIALYAVNSPEWVQWELGIWLAGCVSVSIHPATSDLELQRMLDQTHPKMILVETDSFKERISKDRDYSGQIFRFNEITESLFDQASRDEALLVARGEVLLNQLSGDERQMIIFTSGTTGIPKVVALTLKQLTFVADSLNREWSLPFADGSLFSFLPLSHIAEKIHAIAVAITQRYPVWFNSRYERFMQELQEVRPVFLLAVPRVWERIKQQVENHQPKLFRHLREFNTLGRWAEKIYLKQVRSSLGLDKLWLAVSGAAKLPPSVGEWFMSIGIEIQEIYGMSESTGLITMTRKHRKSFNGVGRPPLGVEVKLSPDGEIWVRGPQIFAGYDQPDLDINKVLLEEGWLKTGDLGEWIHVGTPHEELQIVGRNREIIKLSNGRMVAPAPIENAIKEIPEVSNVCVVGEGYSHLLALVTLTDAALLEIKFKPGEIEGLKVENEALNQKIESGIQRLIDSGKISEKHIQFVIIARDFSIAEKELTAAHKLNRAQISKNFRYFIQLNYEDE